MKITFENPDGVNGLMTLVVEEADFKDKVEKKLKEYRQKAQMPGFRKGMVPMSLIKRQYGTAVKVDEVNKILGEEIYKYVRENKISMLGDPLPSDKQVAVDIEKEAPYTFVFDIAVAPDFKIELSNNDTVDYYNINVDDELINRQADNFAQRAGHYEKVEEYQENDMLKGDLRELDQDGNTLEGGIELSEAIVMPTYIKDEEQKALFDGSRLGDIITFNPRKAYASDAELASFLKVDKADLGFHAGNFSYQLTEISRYVKAEVNQQLFDQVYGEGTVKSEEEFRQKIADGLKAQFVGDSDMKFLLDIRKYCEEKVGDLQFPEELLKRIMKNNNKDKGDDFVEKNFEGSVKELKWHLIKEQLVEAAGIKIDENDIRQAAREAARAQFAQYGMGNVPDEYLDNYANDMLKKKEYADGLVDRSIDSKLIQAMKTTVKLNTKAVSLADFNKMFEK
jgi:trigger factor